MRKLWLAERHIDYEGDDVLGVFTTKGKAIAECQAYDDGIGDEETKRELNFYQLPTAENHPVIFKAHGLAYEYYVREVEVNVPLMREVEKSEKPSLDSDLAKRVQALEAKLERMDGDGK